MNTVSEQPKQPSGVNIATIERELTSLWKAASEDEHSGITRACLLNLLVYVPSQAELTKADDCIIDVTATHPSRAILIVSDRESEDSSINAQVTSRCTIPTGSSKQVCCEQVTITATGEMINEVPSVVVPLLLSDLPVYLWWNAVPRLGDRIFKRLVEVSDRVIIDSADFANPQEDMASLAAVLRDSPRWTAISDLNWARLTAWRALVASFYDVPQYRPLLDQMNRVVIEYAPASGDSAQVTPRAALLAGWIASRLGWHLADGAPTSGDNSTIYNMVADGRNITIEFVSISDPGIKPGLARATFSSAADESASFVVRRSGDGNRIETLAAIGEERQIQRVLNYDDWSESALIARELEILGHDRVYEQAVTSAGELFGALNRS